MHLYPPSFLSWILRSLSQAHVPASVAVPYSPTSVMSLMRSLLHLLHRLHLHEAVEALICGLTPVPLGTSRALVGVPCSPADLFLELKVEQEILVLAVLLRDL